MRGLLGLEGRRIAVGVGADRLPAPGQPGRSMVRGAVCEVSAKRAAAAARVAPAGGAPPGGCPVCRFAGAGARPRAAAHPPAGRRLAGRARGAVRSLFAAAVPVLATVSEAAAGRLPAVARQQPSRQSRCSAAGPQACGSARSPLRSSPGSRDQVLTRPNPATRVRPLVAAWRRRAVEHLPRIPQCGRWRRMVVTRLHRSFLAGRRRDLYPLSKSVRRRVRRTTRPPMWPSSHETRVSVGDRTEWRAKRTNQPSKRPLQLHPRHRP